MYPRDNIFNIYYNIGRIVPFQVKRADRGFQALPQNLYKPSGRTFMVEKVEPKGKYGKAYGYCLQDNVRSDEYMKNYYPDYNTDDIAEIPCAGCGAWVLIDVPGRSMYEIFPLHKADDVLPFGKYKNSTFAEVYKKDAQYIYYLMETDPYFRVDILGIIGALPKDKDEAAKMLEDEYYRVFPKITEETVLTFGKYRGKSLKEIKEQDPGYLNWLAANNIDLNRK